MRRFFRSLRDRAGTSFTERNPMIIGTIAIATMPVTMGEPRS